MKFEKDRKRWRYWLYEAKKRYGLCVLNYIVTSNHIHLLVVDTEQGVIANSLQLIAGRTAQEFNRRKQRKGAFWEDRYHATAIETDEHLARCMVYIDLNMVRAGVVKHPAEYRLSGFYEIQNPPKRYTVIDYTKLRSLFSIHDDKQFQQHHLQWVESELMRNNAERMGCWSESIAVGSEQFIENVQRQLGSRAKGRSIAIENERTVLREPLASYNALFGAEKSTLSPDNSYFWRQNYKATKR